jgi:hypothetical protein
MCVIEYARKYFHCNQPRRYVVVLVCLPPLGMIVASLRLFVLGSFETRYCFQLDWNGQGSRKQMSCPPRQCVSLYFSIAKLEREGDSLQHDGHSVI